MKRKKIFYIHAGMPKTGSTALQMFCFWNEMALKEKCGLHYLKTGRNLNPLEGGTVNIEMELAANKSNKSTKYNKHKCSHISLFPMEEQIWQQVSIEADKVNTDILCSYEHAATLLGVDSDMQQTLGSISRLLPDYDIKFIIYLRRIDEIAKSFYKEELRTRLFIEKIIDPSGDFLSDPDFFKYEYHIEKDRGMLNAIANFIHCARLFFPNDGVLVKLYDVNNLKNNNIIDDFFDCFGINVINFNFKYSDVKRNVSLPDDVIPLLQNLYVFDDSRNFQIESLLHKKIHDAYLTKSAANVDNTLDWREFNSLIQKVNSIAPGYAALFELRPCSFNYPEIDCTPRTRFLYSLLFSIFADQIKILDAVSKLKKQLEASQREAILNQLKMQNSYSTMLSNNWKENIIYILFPNFIQRTILLLLRIYLYLLNKQQYAEFRSNLRVFLLRTDLKLVRIVRRILRLFGPIPPLVSGTNNLN
jgi:hypothetical protein